MTKLRVHNLALSLDGFAAGEDRTVDAPFGHAHDRLMRWFFPTRTFVSMSGHDAEAVGRGGNGRGRHVRVRDHRGDRSRDHGARQELGPGEALALASELAGGLDVRLGGGASTVRDFLDADLVDYLHVVVVPVILGRGVRLWDGQESLEDRFLIEAASSPSGVVHYTFTRRPR